MFRTLVPKNSKFKIPLNPQHSKLHRKGTKSQSFAKTFASLSISAVKKHRISDIEYRISKITQPSTLNPQNYPPPNAWFLLINA